MSWLTDEYKSEMIQLAKQLLDKYGEAITWEQASEAVLPDTLELAAWDGMRKAGQKASLTPYYALKRLKGLCNGLAEENGSPGEGDRGGAVGAD